MRAEKAASWARRWVAGNVVKVEEETFEPSPETLSARLRSVILVVHNLDGQSMHVLDTDRTCEVQGA